MAANKVYQIVTEKILAILDRGTVPWRKPWTSTSPENLLTKKPYRGINFFLLASQGYASPYWLTMKQANLKGGKVRKGEASTPVIFWNWKEKKNKETEEVEKYPVIRYYRVWNIEQTEGIEIKNKTEAEDENANFFNPIAKAMAIIGKIPNPPKIEHKEDKAFYQPSTDTVNLPNPELFNSAEEYYSVAYHEIAHAVGAETRLNRPGVTSHIFFGSDKYSKEELIAEMTSAFLCGHAGISPKVVENQAAYLDGWRKKISEDPKLVVQAAAEAQKAADYVLDRRFEAAFDKKR